MHKTNAFLPPAHRISSFDPYFFASLGKKIAQLKANGMDVIRIDMGSPDLPPSDFIIDKLVSESRKPENHGYSPLSQPGTQ